MGVKQFPADYADITTTVNKLMAVKADGTMGFALVATLKAVLGISLQDVTDPLKGGRSTTNSVAIGTTDDPRSTLDVKGVLTADGWRGGGAGGDIVFNYGPTAGGGSFEYYGGNESSRFKVNNSGNVTASGTITPGSDKRLKKLIKTLSSALDAIISLRPVSYVMKLDNAPSMGFIADEVREVFPDLILERDDDDKMLSMNYMGLTAPIVKAIQEQQIIIQALEDRIQALESK